MQHISKGNKPPTSSAPAGAAGTHVKACTDRPDSYPPRTAVPADAVDWAIPLLGYCPREYTALKVIEKDRSKNPNDPSLWADPADPRLVRSSIQSFEGALQFDGDRPLNPRGRTGISGRGELGCWGPNRAADPIVTRFNPNTGAIEALLIERVDSGDLAIPGGMHDRTDPNISATLARELSEETGARLNFAEAAILYRGYVDDRRNTDNAWIETTVSHLHLSAEQAAALRLIAGDDARPGSARWVPLTPEVIAGMYASHGNFLRLALGRL